ncbi:Tyrosine-protein phosphatase non-receptor type 4 [Frankliniella fusca]|uniref:Tyrosine-protein phosphatase non-receptor type 4 n=1 Tax=Frankliniella fusca TaxID=407009 RepID=A0AAE1HRN4_9NEOP|nr:Tyrosine-protein phosphatase non-receptor type 4 [Frankliniella fusca]
MKTNRPVRQVLPVLPQYSPQKPCGTPYLQSRCRTQRCSRTPCSAMGVDPSTLSTTLTLTPPPGDSSRSRAVPLVPLRVAPPPPSAAPQDARGFQDAVCQALAAVAGSLESMACQCSASTPASAPQLEHQDPEELFARSLAASLRRLPKPRRSQAKMRLIAVLDECEGD